MLPMHENSVSNTYPPAFSSLPTTRSIILPLLPPLPCHFTSDFSYIHKQHIHPTSTCIHLPFHLATTTFILSHISYSFSQHHTPSQVPPLTHSSTFHKHHLHIIPLHPFIPSRNHFDSISRTNCQLSCHPCHHPISILNILYLHQHLKQFIIIDIDHLLSAEMLAALSSPSLKYAPRVVSE